MSIPNMISLLRVGLVPMFVGFYANGRVLPAMGVLLLSAASDVLDGAIARRFHMETELGKVLDPLADKLIQGAMMLCAAVRFPTVWLLLGLHVLREIVLSLLGLHVLRVTGRVYSAKWYGKLCTVLIYTAMIGLLAFPEALRSVADAVLLLCAVGIALCLCLYFLNFLRILREYRQDA